MLGRLIGRMKHSIIFYFKDDYSYLLMNQIISQNSLNQSKKFDLINLPDFQQESVLGIEAVKEIKAKYKTMLKEYDIDVLYKDFKENPNIYFTEEETILIDKLISENRLYSLVKACCTINNVLLDNTRNYISANNSTYTKYMDISYKKYYKYKKKDSNLKNVDYYSILNYIDKESFLRYTNELEMKSISEISGESNNEFLVFPMKSCLNNLVDEINIEVSVNDLVNKLYDGFILTNKNRKNDDGKTLVEKYNIKNVDDFIRNLSNEKSEFRSDTILCFNVKYKRNTHNKTKLKAEYIANTENLFSDKNHKNAYNEYKIKMSRISDSDMDEYEKAFEKSEENVKIRLFDDSISKLCQVYKKERDSFFIGVNNYGNYNPITMEYYDLILKIKSN